MRIQILSDLHLDGSSLDCPVDADILVLAGDTAVYPELTYQWVERCVPASTTVLFIPGNHEYEGFEIHSRDEQLSAFFSPLKNLVFLQNDVYIKDNVRFLGTTLWTDFAAFPQYGTREALMKEARYQIIDFTAISVQEKEGKRRFEPTDAAQLHKKASVFLSSTLLTPFEGKTVVISHFLPTPRCIDPSYAGQKVNSYFASNMEHVMADVDLWIHGHTHKSVDFELGKTRILCNPRGYSRRFDLAENEEFDRTLTLNLHQPTPKKHSGP